MSTSSIELFFTPTTTELITLYRNGSAVLFFILLLMAGGLAYSMGYLIYTIIKK